MIEAYDGNTPEERRRIYDNVLMWAADNDESMVARTTAARNFLEKIRSGELLQPPVREKPLVTEISPAVQAAEWQEFPERN